MLIAVAIILNAQTPFEKAIMDGLTQLDSAKTGIQMQTVVSRFERIAMAESSRWEPYYYVAFLKIQLSFKEKDDDRKDALLDEAQNSIDKAIYLGGSKSELFTLQGFLYQGRIQVSPMMRGQSYSVKASEILEKAIAENPDNPRAYYLLGQNYRNTPKMFGGGCKNALPNFIIAKEKYEKENGKTGINPKWGSKSNSSMIEKCNEE